MNKVKVLTVRSDYMYDILKINWRASFELKTGKQIHQDCLRSHQNEEGLFRNKEFNERGRRVCNKRR